MGSAIYRYSEKGRPMTGFEPTLPPNTAYVKKNIDKIFEPQKSLRNVDFSGFYFVLVAGSSQLSNLFFEDYYSILALAS